MTAQAPSHIVIAIDGPSGVGKSTVAKRLAQCLGYWYVDSGALYRAVGWAVHACGVPFDDCGAIVELLERTSIKLRCQDGQSEVWVGGKNITFQLRGEEVGKAASAVATMPAVRRIITARLRQVCCQVDVVIEGRDIGTVVFPEATVKFFLDASLVVRGQRRFREMRQAGQEMTLGQVVQAVTARDTQDRTRAAAPLRLAVEAHVIDTTDLTVDDVVRIMLSEIHAKVQ
jgi:cytidylate kinase